LNTLIFFIYRDRFVLIEVVVVSKELVC